MFRFFANWYLILKFAIMTPMPLWAARQYVYGGMTVFRKKKRKS
jgi:hypothetical protein